MIVRTILTLVTVFLIGCATNQPQLLSTEIVHRGPPAINPSLSLPSKGDHYHASMSFNADARFGDLQTDERGTTFLIGSGWYHQPDLTTDFLVSPYWGIDGAASYSLVRFKPSDSAATVLDSHNIDYRRTFSDFGFEMYAKPGVIGKFYIGTFSIFGIGMIKGEMGDYYDFRKNNDGIATLYNLTVSPISVGYGYGADLQLGNANYWDIGILLQVEILLNRTQSYQADHDVEATVNGVTTYTNVVDTVPGGVYHKLVNARLESYLDILNYRLSASGFILGPYSLNASYRF